MEPHEARRLHRFEIAQILAKLHPPPTDEWIAQQVDRLVPLNDRSPADNGYPAGERTGELRARGDRESGLL